MKNLYGLLLIALGSTLVITGCSDYPVNPFPGSGNGGSTGTDEVGVQKFISDPIDGKYIVVLNENPQLRDNEELVRQKAEELVQSVGGEIAGIEWVYAHSILGFSAALTPIMVEELSANDAVNYIEQDQMITINQFDPTKKPSNPGGKPGGGGGGTTQPPQQTPYGITRHGGGITVSSTDGPRGWIIDTGIDPKHPDLNVSGSWHKGQGDSRSFLSGKQSTNPDDQNGHGTHVSGTVAAIDNDFGVIGIAAGAEVVSVRVLDRRGSGSYSGVIAGVDYVAASANSNDAANMSLGGGFSQAVNDAVIAASATCPFAIAAGNSSTSATGSSPASANGANIYTISAMDSLDNWAYFSNYGNPPVDYCASGVSVYSTYKGGTYTRLSGTSMASPHVCGLLLLGPVIKDGYVNNDPDGNADPIAHH